MYVNLRNSQLVRSYSVIPSGTPKIATSQSPTHSNHGSSNQSHYKRPSFAYRGGTRGGNQEVSKVSNSAIKTRSNTVNSITMSTGSGPRLPPLPRLSSSSRNSNDSIKNNGNSMGTSCVTSRFGPPPESLMRGLESSTSNSIFHGMVLIVVMTTSLVSFIGSLMYDFCDVPFNCSRSIHTFFTITSILSCTFCFLVYFLHLVGQCDYVTWSAKRKVMAEILFTMVIFILVVSTIVTATHHSLWKNPPIETSKKIITIISIVSLLISAICYIVRILSLTLEVRMLRNKPPESDQNETVDSIVSRHGNRKLSIKSCSSSSTNFATIAHPPPYSVSMYNPKASFSRHKQHDVIREVSTNSNQTEGFPRSHGNLTLIEDDEVFIDV